MITKIPTQKKSVVKTYVEKNRRLGLPGYRCSKKNGSTENLRFQVTMLNFKHFPSKKNAQQQDPTSEDVPPQAAENHVGRREQIMARQPTPPNVPLRNRGLIAGLIKGNQWVFISP